MKERKQDTIKGIKKDFDEKGVLWNAAGDAKGWMSSF
jgi:hypothetical protein